MNAVNPAPATPTTGGDQRLYEPSMEEILASIRRIIADDQRLPAPLGHPDVLQPADTAMPAPAEAAFGIDAKPIAQQHGPAFDQPGVDRSKPVLAGERSEIDGATSRTAPQSNMFAPPSPTPAAPAMPPRDESSASEPFTSVAGLATSAAMHSPELDDHGTSKQARLAAAESADVECYDAALADGVEQIDPFVVPPIERDQPLPKAETPAGLFSPHTKQSVTSSFNLLAATRLADNSEELLGLAREMIRPLLKTWLDDNLPSMVERMVRAEIERVARGGRD